MPVVLVQAVYCYKKMTMVGDTIFPMMKVTPKTIKKMATPRFIGIEQTFCVLHDLLQLHFTMLLSSTP